MNLKYALLGLTVVATGAGFVIAAGCESDAATTPAPPDPSGPLTSYVPEGCDYTVYVPEDIASAGRDDGIVGANPAPDHIHASWAGPTASSFTINWRSGKDTTATQLLFGSDQAAVAGASGATSGVTLASGHTMLYGSVLDGDNQTRVHEVHVCGLTPSSTYFYKVGGPGAWSEVYDFATAPEAGAKELFQFGVTGDSRNDPDVWASVQREISDFGVDFQLFTGDAVATGVVQQDWNAWFEAKTSDFAFQDAIARAPFMLVNGNHESLAVNYVTQFALPQDVTGDERANGEEWYAFDYANLHVIALNDTPEASALGATQLGWLEADLAQIDRSRTPWVVVMHHRSTYSCGGSHSSDLDLRAAWQPIFDKHKVDIVFSGHDHLYERTRPVRGLNGQEGIVAAAAADGGPIAESGTVYVVAAGGGAPLYGADDSCAQTYLTKSVRNYVIVQIEDRHLHLTAYELGGAKLDEFDYSK